MTRNPKPKNMLFDIGDVVRISEEGLEIGLNPRCDPNRLGTIIGFSNNSDCVWVLWDGLKTSSGMCYHVSFLKEVMKE